MANTNVPIAGRLYDVVLLQASNPAISGPRTADLLNPPATSSSVTGILKLVQRVVLEFFTVKGSMIYIPTRGCSFLSALYQGRIRTDTDVHQEFAFASSDILANLTADALSTDPPDELLDSLDLLAYDIQPGNLYLQVSIKSLAGTSASLVLPITTSP